MRFSELTEELARAFRRADISSPRVEARAIAAASAGLAYDAPEGTEIPEDAVARARENMSRRLNGCPAAYICGTWEFYGLEFTVNEQVLIPRQDTETLCDRAIALGRSIPAPRILDLCCGSGCIGISVAKSLPGAKVVLSDLSPDALDVASKNADAHLRPGQWQTELRDARLPRTEQDAFDLITCNPPYVTEEEYGALSPSVREYEPRMALVGGENGLEFYRAVPRAVEKALAPGGTLLFEVGCGQAEPVAEILSNQGWQSVAVFSDTAGIRRVVSAKPRE